MSPAEGFPGPGGAGKAQTFPSPSAQASEPGLLLLSLKLSDKAEFPCLCLLGTSAG